jgi:hypothetical protein
VLITPRLVRALEPDEVPPLPTLPRRFLPAPGVGGVEKGAPDKTDKSGGDQPAAVPMVDGPAVAPSAPKPSEGEAKGDAKGATRRPGAKD